MHTDISGLAEKSEETLKEKGEHLRKKTMVALFLYNFLNLATEIRHWYWS